MSEGIGARVLRKEDLRFLTGRGEFVADVAAPDALHCAIVRSPHAHARIRAIDASAAFGTGVAAVLTGTDMAAHGVGPDERVDGLPDGPERRAFARGSPRPLPSGTLDERAAVPAGGHHVGDLGIHVAACRPQFARASRRRFRWCETIPAASRTSPKACLWGRA